MHIKDKSLVVDFLPHICNHFNNCTDCLHQMTVLLR